MTAATTTNTPPLRIRPPSGWVGLDLPNLWRFRDLLFTLAHRDLRLRYRQTALGVIWVILQPLTAAGIFSFVFGSVAKLPSDGIPYFFFSYAGLLGWNAFSSTLSKASGSLLASSGLVSKVYFPRLILPLSTVLSSLVDLAVALVVLLGAMIAKGMPITPAILTLPIWIALLIALSLGLGAIASVVMAKYRDVQHVIPVAIPFLMYASPVAYAASVVPDHLRIYLYLNPLTSLLEATRWSVLGRGEVDWNWVCYSSAMAAVIFLFGCLIFRNLERKVADVI